MGVLSVLRFTFVLGALFSIVFMISMAHAQPCGSLINNSFFPVDTKNSNEESLTGKTKCSDSSTQLLILNRVNNTGCSTGCLSPSNFSISVSGNNSKPIALKGSTSGSTVTLCPGQYNVSEPLVSLFYGQNLSRDCSGVISAGETKKCTITNSYLNTSNNVQALVDKTSNLQIQFSYSPPYPFVGNVTQLNFEVTSLNASKPLQAIHVHVALIRNVTDTSNNKNNLVTFDNITATRGTFSLKYQFLEDGAHQIIVKVITEDGKAELASFVVPVLFPE
jgi:hypothetical protein